MVFHPEVKVRETRLEIPFKIKGARFGSIIILWKFWNKCSLKNKTDFNICSKTNLAKDGIVLESYLRAKMDENS